MSLALSWGIQASYEMPRFIHPVSSKTPYTATFSRLFCTTKEKPLRVPRCCQIYGEEAFLGWWWANAIAARIFYLIAPLPMLIMAQQGFQRFRATFN